MKSYAWKIYMLTAANFLVGTSEYIIAGILDKVAADLGVSVSAAGQLITVFSLAFAIGTPILMAMTSGVDRRKMLLYSLGIFVVGNAVAFLLPGFSFLMVSRVILALGTGIFFVTAMTVASKLAPSEKQGSAIATIVMGFSTSLVVGVPLGRVVASFYDWKVVFGGIGILGLFAILAVSLLIPKSEAEESMPIRQQLSLLKEPRIIMALMITFFLLTGYSIAYTYITPFLLDITGMSEQGVSIGLLAFGIASLFGSKFGGYSSDKWGVYPTLFGGMLVQATALILIFIAGQSAVFMLPLLVFWSFSAWTSGPTQQFNLVQQAPEAAGVMLSLNSSMLQLAMAAGAGIGGVVIEQISLISISWIGAIGVTVAAATAVVSLRLSRSEARRKAERSVVYNRT
ncbi:MFS transporter [Paenibacillus tritici]|uniref:MFS transporter n=1 Tax=Paenibacillus tritici TaxID=1873425 RepID=UPI001BAA1B22|nr:MFS transporter [Paenibacillus tritici]QUL52296.1 MFS transporter [Paenibacillus tritici]